MDPSWESIVILIADNVQVVAAASKFDCESGFMVAFSSIAF